MEEAKECCEVVRVSLYKSLKKDMEQSCVINMKASTNCMRCGDRILITYRRDREEGNVR